LLPVRANGLVLLRKFLLNSNKNERKQKIVNANKKKILEIFKRNVKEKDSYLFLAAIQGLSAIAEFFPNEIIPELFSEN